MIKLKTHAVAVAMAGALALGTLAPCLASQDEGDQPFDLAMTKTVRSPHGKIYVYSIGPMSAFAFETDNPALAIGFNGDAGNDVFINGEYVGSDPDARVRGTIRSEARGNDG